ncbi:MAG: hypothetical protein ABWZ16_11755, partial [Microbacterium sp.]
GPPASTSSTAASFAFTSSEAGSTFQCSLDGAAFAGCTSPAAYSGLAPGAHTFAVRAVDPAGNVDPVPAARAFRIDTKPPRTTIDRGPAGRTTDLTPTWRFSSSERASTFECHIDKAEFTPCASPFTAPGRKRGAHRFSVRARDAAGNVDATPASRRYTALLLIRSRIGHVWAFNSRATTLVRLVVKDLPAAARIALRCRGAGCPFQRRVVRPRRGRRAVLTGRFRGARLTPGSVVEIRITAPDAIGKVSRFTIRSNAVPTLADRCLPPGRKRPVKCTKVLGRRSVRGG